MALLVPHEAFFGGIWDSLDSAGLTAAIEQLFTGFLVNVVTRVIHSREKQILFEIK